MGAWKNCFMEGKTLGMALTSPERRVGRNGVFLAMIGP